LGGVGRPNSTTFLHILNAPKPDLRNQEIKKTPRQNGEALLYENRTVLGCSPL
jgi:hypothetical protein